MARKMHGKQIDCHMLWIIDLTCYSTLLLTPAPLYPTSIIIIPDHKHFLSITFMHCSFVCVSLCARDCGETCHHNLHGQIFYFVHLPILFAG